MRKFGAKLLEVLRKGDMVLLALCVLTSVFGIVMVAASTAYDGSSRYVIIQTGALITGILLYLALTAFDIDILAGQRTLLFLFNTAFLAMLLVWGVEGTSGNKSWLHFPFLPFNIQPAEVCKITYIIILAKTMSLNRNRISSLRSVGTLTFHMLWIVALIVVISHDTGVALIFMFLFVVMAYVGGVSGWWFLGGAGAVAAVSPYLWKYFIRDDQKQRILALIDPSIDPDGLGVLWQTNKSLEALRNGGLTGQGLLSGEHIFVPNAWNDFIFAYLANVLGFLGAAAVLLLLFALCLRTLRTGLQCPDALGCNICVGIFAALFLQCVINIGMNLQVLPVIGVTLPFFSAGGSSVVMMYLCVGIVLSVGMNTRRSKLEMQQIL